MTGLCAKRNIIFGVITVLVCLFCTLLLSACNSDNKSDVKVNEKQNDLYLMDIVYDSDELTMCMIVGFKGREDDKLYSVLNWKSTSYPLNILFRQEDVQMTVNPSAIFGEIDGGLTNEQRVHEGVEYNRLKVALRYDTIYKSISSDGDVSKEGRYYLHLFDFDEALSEQTFTLHLKTQITANWYTLLIAIVLILAVVIVAVMLAVKGKLWQKKKM